MSFITSIVTALRRRLKQAAVRRNEARALGAHKRYWNDEVALCLADLVLNTETKASGRVQILSLAEFRGVIGDLWTSYSMKVVLIAETTIARMIGKGNTFIPQGDDAWLLLFPGLPPPEARQRADAMAAKIGEKLVGENFTPDNAPPPLATILETEGVVRPDGSIDGEALHAAVERARHPKKKPTPKPPEAKTETKPAAAPRPHIDLALRPAWSLETEIIDTFALRALGARGEDLISDPEIVYTPTMAIELCAAAANLLYLMEARKLRGRLVLPFSHGVVMGSQADAIRKKFLEIPQRLRLLHLRVDIVRIPPRFDIGEIAALREALRPLAREVGLALDPAQVDQPLYALEHVVFSAEITPALRWDDRRLHDGLSDLRVGAAKQRAAVSGLRSRAQVLDAIGVGIDEISGPGLAADLRQLPERLSVLPRRDLSPV